MRLTNEIRKAFVGGVMRDVPSVDHEEMIRSVVLAHAVSRLPPPVREVWNNPELRAYIETRGTSYGGVTVRYPSDPTNGVMVLAPDVQAEVGRLHALQKAQDAQRDQLEHRLRQVAASVSTRKALAEALPEFAKYLPADHSTALRSLPTVTGTVEMFKAAGWPAR